MTSFNLYHVTNGFFINSIKKYGLGGVNPVQKYSLLKVLEEVHLISEEKIPEHQTIKAFKDVTKLMIEQRNEIVKNPYNGSFQKQNFSHGDLYLNANEKRAVFFAKIHLHGSEILNRVITYLNVFDKEKITYDYTKYCGDLDLNRIRQNKPNTFLIRFKSYEGLNLESEDRQEKKEIDAILNNDDELRKRINDPNFNCIYFQLPYAGSRKQMRGWQQAKKKRKKHELFP